MGQLHRRVGNGRQVHGKAVILGGDLHPAGKLILHRLVGPPVPELELEGPTPQGQPQELVAQADAEHGLGAEALADVVHGIGDRGRVPGTVAEDDAVGRQRQDRGGRGGAGTTRTSRPLAFKFLIILNFTP